MTDRASDRARWTTRYETEPDSRAPSDWILAACMRIPTDDTIIEIAAGSGRNAAALARLGRRVVAIDFVEVAIRRAADSPGVHGVVADAWELPLRMASAEALLCTNFLERRLFSELKALIKPGGFLVYETYTIDHRQLVEAGRARAPRSADYFLERGELARLVAPFTILDQREGLVHDAAGERYCASILARKTSLTFTPRTHSDLGPRTSDL